MRDYYIPIGHAWGLVKYRLDQGEAIGNMGAWPSTPVYIYVKVELKEMLTLVETVT